MKYIVIGDIHLNKSYFPTMNLVPNEYFNFKDENIFSIWTRKTIEYIRSSCAEILNREQHVEVVFLGDVFDVYNPSQEIKELFRERVLDFLLQFPNCIVSIVVGNHDSNSKVQKRGISALYSFHSYHNRLRIFEQSFFDFYRPIPTFYLPFIRQDRLLNNISKHTQGYNFDKLLIFSHNNIHINSIFRGTPMVKKKDIPDRLRMKDENVVLFNGHLHSAYYENTMMFPGSVSPTSVKDDFQSSGICVFDSQKGLDEVFKNSSIAFLSISSWDYIDRLEYLLFKAREVGCCCFLSIPLGLRKYIKSHMKKFSDIIIAIHQRS